METEEPSKRCRHDKPVDICGQCAEILPLEAEIERLRQEHLEDLESTEGSWGAGEIEFLRRAMASKPKPENELIESLLAEIERLRKGHETTPLADDSPEVQAWDAERQRLMLAASCALKALMTHMGPVEAMYLPYDGEMLEVKRVKQEVSG